MNKPSCYHNKEFVNIFSRWPARRKCRNTTLIGWRRAQSSIPDCRRRWLFSGTGKASVRPTGAGVRVGMAGCLKQLPSAAMAVYEGARLRDPVKVEISALLGSRAGQVLKGKMKGWRVGAAGGALARRGAPAAICAPIPLEI